MQDGKWLVVVISKAKSIDLTQGKINRMQIALKNLLKSIRPRLNSPISLKKRLNQRV